MKRKVILTGISIILLIVFISFSSCENAPVKKNNIDKSDSFKKNSKKLLKLPAFLSDKEKEEIINSSDSLSDKKPTHKGIKPLPQDYDDYRKVNLDKVYWKGMKAVGADFRGASLRSANCEETNFSHSDFRVADVRWALFNRALLYNCDFRQAMLFHVHVTDAQLDSSDFQGANMFGMTGHRASLKYCDFTNALLKDVEFTHANFSYSTAIKTRFIRAVLTSSDFKDCNFSGSDFSGAGLEGASFENADLSGVNFGGAHLQEADFNGANLKGCNFYGAEMRNTNFTNAKNIPAELKKYIHDNFITDVISSRK